MKKRLIALFLSLILLGAHGASAAPLDFSGGVNNEYQYEEYVFITGEPIKFIGTYDVSERDKDTEKTVTYNFKLTPEDKSIDAKLDRRITLVTTYTQRSDKGQTTAQTELTKYRETLRIGDDRYELEDFQLSQSDVIDNRPASDFYSGNMRGRKYYTINRNEGEVIIDIMGGNVGYENFWGCTDTVQLDYRITSKRQIEVDDEEDETEDLSWSGTVQIQVSDSRAKTVRYSDNETNFSSFHGGHIRITNQEMVSRYEYNLPRVRDGIPDDNRRNRGTLQLRKEMVPKLERLTIPKFRDVGGHWAENAINQLYALDIFEEQSTFFLPDIPMTRSEFTKAIIRACNIRTTIVEEKPRRSRRNTPPEVSPFWDVAVTDPNYLYIKDALQKGIVSGISPNRFAPDKPLTKAQAITILIRALGFENKAPTPGFYTAFADDRNIPSWAKDNVYVAREIGLISGDSYNRFYPSKNLTKAEAAALLIRFLEFLQEDLQRDYRENIINY